MRVDAGRTAEASTTREGFAYSLDGQNPLAAPLNDTTSSDARVWMRVDDGAFAPATLNDRGLQSVIDFLKTPYARLNLPDPGTRRSSVRDGKSGNETIRERVLVPARANVETGKGNVGEKSAPISVANSTADELMFDDDDDDIMADIDVEQVMMHKRSGSLNAVNSSVTVSLQMAPIPARQAMTPAPMSAPRARVLEQSRAPPSGPSISCQAPPLNGSGADWRCEHGVPLHACSHRASHIEKLRPVLANIVFQLEDDDVALKNSDRKVLVYQRMEAETIIRVCEDGSRNSFHPSAPMMSHSMPVDGSRMIEAPRHQVPPQYGAPSTSAWTAPPAGDDPNDFPGWNDDLPIGDDVVIPMNGIGAVNVGSNVVVNDCQMKGGDAKDWGHTNFQWSKLCEQTLRNTFNAKSFRSLQLLAVNATMAARDCLVLMPTGGGKSLCYQLPAVVKPGITVVISPLISLIQDQLHHLSEMGIPATVLSAAKDSDNTIYDDLRSPTPELRLLYVTPEKVVRSGKLKTALQRLYERGMLNRFVLDEAHCISAWGHDFRKDYTELRGLKHLFPTTPIMCLTATATRRVQDDIVRQLNLPKCLRFFDTFNRTNLTYEVHPKLKGKQMVNEIKNLIVSRKLMRNNRVQCGIIYCFSQADCEKIATELNKIDRSVGDRERFPKRLRAVPYHAGLADNVRKKHQEMWQRDEVNIICATVAFGMGINKPNVRFVFHHSMPKSLEAYHQESGRAGRDGDHGLCILFYSWGDASKARSMLIDSARRERAQPAVLQNNLESLNTMVSYCENLADCRRTQLMAHFDERFERSHCRGMCDSCHAIANGVKFEQTDITEYARGIINIVKSTPEGIGIGLLVDVFRGSSAKTVTQKQYNRLPGYGSGKGLDKSESERIARAMVLRGFLSEKTVRSEGAGPFATTVTTIHYERHRCEPIQQGRERFSMAFTKRRASAGKKVPVTTTVIIGTQPSTQPGTQSDVDGFLADMLNPNALEDNQKEQDMRNAVFAALTSWRKRMAHARELKTGKPVSLDVAFPPNLLQLLQKVRPRTADDMKKFIESGVDKANERTAIKKNNAEVLTVIKQAVECMEKGIPNPYVEDDNREEDEIEEDLDVYVNELPRMSQRRSSQQPAHSELLNAVDPSPAWKKARRDSDVDVT